MSDKQKGLIQACQNTFPNAEHRFCVKHLHSNWSTAGFRGWALRRALWGAAKATTLAQFNDKMRAITELDEDAARWLFEKPVREWSRSHFGTHSKCDILLNNLCETLNAKILDAREQSILSLFETLRLFMMERIHDNRERAQKKMGEQCNLP